MIRMWVIRPSRTVTQLGPWGVGHRYGVGVVDDDRALVVAVGSNEVRPGEDLDERAHEVAERRCALQPARRGLADDVVGDVGHGPLEVVRCPGPVVGERGLQGLAVGATHAWVLLSEAGSISVETPAQPPGERCRDADGASTLELAQAGSEEAFRQLTAPHVDELRLHCYRMLGSLDDAEDLLQETLMAAAWRGLDWLRGTFVTVRGWLYRIATNRCLNTIRSARRRRRRPSPSQPLAPFLSHSLPRAKRT